MMVITLPTKQFNVNLTKMCQPPRYLLLRKCWELTCTARAVLPTPPSPSTATLQLSISCQRCEIGMNRTPSYGRQHTSQFGIAVGTCNPGKGRARLGLHPPFEPMSGYRNELHSERIRN